jgi:alpha-L-arabinofuranosidase
MQYLTAACSESNEYSHAHLLQPGVGFAWRHAFVRLVIALISVLGFLVIPTDSGAEAVHAAASPRRAFRTLAANAPEAITTIAINMSQARGKIHPKAFGIVASLKGNDNPELSFFFRTPEGQHKLRELGARMTLFSADRDDWQNPYDAYTAVPVGYPSAMDTTEYLSLNNSLGAEPMIAVNITHRCRQKDSSAPPSSDNVTCEHVTPKMAVDWIKHIKSLGMQKVKYVQLGIEPYAGCRYWSSPNGVNCKDKGGRHKIALHQDEYVRRVKDWAEALKKVEPSIKLGLHLQPGTFDFCWQNPADCGKVSWDEKLLREVGNKIDFVITHPYFVIDTLPGDTRAAQRYSFYREQIDMRVRERGVTVMPSQIRKELVKWLPQRRNLPIVVGEFNASYAAMDDAAHQVAVRASLYTAFAVGELYLDHLQQVKVNKETLPGAERMILLNLHSLPVFVAKYLPLESPTNFVLTPSWHVLSALRGFQGTTMIKSKVKANPQTSFGRPVLKSYAVKKGKQVLVAVFNHDDVNARTANIRVEGRTLKQATFTQVGHTASSFLTQNTPENPNAIVPEAGSVPGTMLKGDSIKGYSFPPHSLTVFTIKVE